MNSKKMRMVALMLLICFTGVLFAGCGSTTKPAVNNEQQLKKVKVAISTWTGFGPLFIARDKGFFKKHGIDLDINVIEGMAERKQALAGKQVDSLAITFDTATTVVDNGVPIKIIWALADSYGADGLIVKQDVNSVQDLKGKTVAFDAATASHILLTAILEKNNMTEKDFNVVQMTPGDAGAAFVAGKVDAALSWEPWLSKAQNGKILVTSKDFPGMIVDTIALREDFVKENPDVPQKIVDAMKEAMTWYYASPENTAEGNKIMAQGFKESVEEFNKGIKTVKLYNYDENVKMFGDAQNPGVFYSTMQRAADLYYNAKKINSKPDPKNVIDSSYLKNAQ